jgi:hypothetical protein
METKLEEVAKRRSHETDHTKQDIRKPSRLGMDERCRLAINMAFAQVCAVQSLGNLDNLQRIV